MEARSFEEFLRATADRPPRETLIEALDAFEREQSTDLQRTAVDLGCGAGADSLELLRRGWTVLAVDREPAAIELLLQRVQPADRDRIETLITSFEELLFPSDVDLINASYSLPFCPPSEFDGFWDRLSTSIRPGGRFAGHFFGDRDEWADDPSITFHSNEQVRATLTGFDIESLLEKDEDGSLATGEPKHWHLFSVVARKK